MLSKLLLVTALLFITCASYAEVVSETLITLQQDGRSFLQQRTIRSHRYRYDFYIDKSIAKDDFVVIDPQQYSWIEEDENENQLHFDTGSFSVTYTGTYTNNVSVDKEGIFTFNSWDQQKNENGHYGLWNTPENFTRFVYTWVVPETMQIIDFKSNRKGQWVSRPNSVSLVIEDDNDITLTIRYREKDTDKDSVIDRLDRCPGSLQGISVNLMGCEKDDDKDGVINRLDQCLSTDKVARVDVTGCALDSDKDGVPDHADQCIGSKKDVMVNTKGCELDSDLDGVVNRFDRCLDTKRHALVDQKGCELDFDGDGVSNSKDKCSHTVKGAEVDFKGCVLDQDKDGVFDSKDKCPVTIKGATVNADGCEPDTDNDGVVDASDQCPDTVDSLDVDFFGCELDTDNDGVADSKDSCPETSEEATVKIDGCEIDTDQDGIVDSNDQCPSTQPGIVIDINGCELDGDNDGVVNSKDSCIDTLQGEEVDATGCSLLTDRVLTGVAFEPGSAVITEDSEPELNKLAGTLLHRKGLEFEVAGHTDSQGAAASNLKLSQLRAEAVLSYLSDKGIDTRLFKAKGYGEVEPVVDNKTAEGRAKNRRVELNKVVR